MGLGMDTISGIFMGMGSGIDNNIDYGTGRCMNQAWTHISLGMNMSMNIYTVPVGLALALEPDCDMNIEHIHGHGLRYRQRHKIRHIIGSRH